MEHTYFSYMFRPLFLFPERVTKLIYSQKYLQQDDKNSFFISAIINYFILSVSTIASFIALWDANELADTPIAIAVSSDAVHATSVSCILICMALLLDLMYDIIYIALLTKSSKSSEKNETNNNWSFVKDIIIKLTFIIGLLLPNVGIVATNNLSFKVSLYIINSTQQNCMIALATFFRLLKSNDAIFNPVYFSFLFCCYNIGQCCDVWNNLHYYKENHLLEKSYNVLIYVGTTGVMLMIFFSFIRLFRKMYHYIIVAIEDYVIVCITVPFLFTILWVQVVDSTTVSIESTISNLLNCQFASIALILALYFIPQRLARQKKMNETNNDLSFAHQLLKKSYDPLKFVQKNLNKFITADELQEIPRSMMLNTIVAQCTTAIAAYENSVANINESKDDIATFVADDCFEINLREEASDISSITFNYTEYEIIKFNLTEVKENDTGKENNAIVTIDDNNFHKSNLI